MSNNLKSCRKMIQYGNKLTMALSSDMFDDYGDELRVCAANAFDVIIFRFNKGL